MIKKAPVFDMNHSKPIVKLVDDEVSTVATELELRRCLLQKIL